MDAHDNRARVTLGGDEFDIVASKRAERIYADRFRDDVEALGESLTRTTVTLPAEEGEAPQRVEQVVPYQGRLKADVYTSMMCPFVRSMELPTQVYAAVWAMGSAAGSTDESWDEFWARVLDMPSDMDEEKQIFEAVCVDLVRRAFFRNLVRQDDAGQPDEGPKRSRRATKRADRRGAEVAGEG